VSQKNQYVKGILVTVFLFLVFFSFRFFVNNATMGKDYTGNIFRIGIVPWSDAKGWVNGAENVMSGKLMPEFPGRRPLYPLFLVVILTFFGLSYKNIIFVQMILSGFSLVAAYLILKRVKPRLSVIIFLCFLAVWRPDVSTVFITENLGIYVLILGFAMIVKGVDRRMSGAFLSGLFCIGLSQAVRPWCILILPNRIIMLRAIRLNLISRLCNILQKKISCSLDKNGVLNC